MKELAAQLYDEASVLLAKAKKNRNWGSIGDFTLDFSRLPPAASSEMLAELRQMVERKFRENKEPGIFILFHESKDGHRVSVGRTNEND